MNNEQTTKKEFTFRKEPGRYTWAQQNTSHHILAIQALTLEGQDLRLLSVQVGVGGWLKTQQAGIELDLSPAIWYPLLELFIEVESAEACEVKVILDVIEYPGESGFESPLD